MSFFLKLIFVLSVFADYSLVCYDAALLTSPDIGVRAKFNTVSWMNYVNRRVSLTDYMKYYFSRIEFYICVNLSIADEEHEGEGQEGILHQPWSSKVVPESVPLPLLALPWQG